MRSIVSRKQGDKVLINTRCGYVALLGRPNAGKSTLFNSLVGQKLAGVSAKAQTTRNRITGVAMHDDCQILLLDTPGLHSHERHQINTMMNKVSWATLSQADFICYLVELKEGWHEEDEHFLSNVLQKTTAPLLLVATKSDRFKKAEIDEALSKLHARLQELSDKLDEGLTERFVQRDAWVISAKQPEALAEFRGFLATRLPVGPWLFSPDQLTDRSERFVVSEMIREQLFRQLGEELPYGCAAVVEKIEEGHELIKVWAQIYVAKTSQKAMVIGLRGARIKEIGIESRKTLEKHFSKPVFLDLHVRVKENWMDNDRLVRELSYLGEDLEE